MIRITVDYDTKQQKYTGFHTLGHAEYAEYGEDIVCSAVSALTITAVNSIEAFTDSSFSTECEQELGRMDYHLDSPVSSEADLLIRAMLLGLEGIQKEYGTKNLKVNTKEV